MAGLGLPSEAEITELLRGARRVFRRYLKTLRAVALSPRELVCEARKRRRPGRAQVAGPVAFFLWNTLIGSVLFWAVNRFIATSRPFLTDPTSQAFREAFSRAAFSWTAYGLHPLVGAEVIGFLVAVGVASAWARLAVGRRVNIGRTCVGLTYLLPWTILSGVLVHAGANVLYFVAGPDSPAQLAYVGIVDPLRFWAVHSVTLLALDRCYRPKGFHRWVHAAGFMLAVPVAGGAAYFGASSLPMVVAMYRVISPFDEGVEALEAQHIDTAGERFKESIDADPSGGYWTLPARLLLVKVHADRIEKSLRLVHSDAELRRRVGLRLSLGTWYAPVAATFQGEPSSIAALASVRESLLSWGIRNGETPITSSELDCALRATRAGKTGWGTLDGIELPVAGRETPEGRVELERELYRRKVLLNEPAFSEGERRYAEFLGELPYRIELFWVDYRARNVLREAETLAHLETGAPTFLDRDLLLAANAGIRDRGLKYPCLPLPDAYLRTLKMPDLVFRMRQMYLSYIAAEARELRDSPFGQESALIRGEVATILSLLSEVGADVRYRQPIPLGGFDRTMLGLFDVPVPDEWSDEGPQDPTGPTGQKRP